MCRAMHASPNYLRQNARIFARLESRARAARVSRSSAREEGGEERLFALFLQTSRLQVVGERVCVPAAHRLVARRRR